jgi:Ca-activated chloride channel homolog
MNHLHFENIAAWYWLIPTLCAIIVLKLFAYKPALYRYSLAQTLIRTGHTKPPTHRRVFTAIRTILLALLVFLIGKPQLIDYHSKISIDGNDIMLVLDISGSMQHRDYEDDERSRLEVAKDEATRFIHKRTNDALGLVIFGNDALSRIPLTLDKKMLEQAVDSLQIGVLDPEGTVLAKALATAANRLKNSKAKSKVIILLTDGAPSPNDIDPAIAIQIAQKLGIKVYTIGIGGDEDQYLMHPLYGLIPKPKINKALLSQIAKETGGTFFLARNAHDMRTIYNTIDALEKTRQETDIFNNYYDIFIPFIWCIIALLGIELLLSSTIWFGI